MSKTEWKYITLDKMGTISRGKSKHRPRNDAVLFGGVYPFIQTSDVKWSVLHIFDYSETYNEIGLQQSKLWPKGTLCITIAANIADTGILGIDACFPDSIMGFIADDKISDVRFVKYCFDVLQKQCQSIAIGTTQDNLSWEKLSKILFPCPPLNVQKQIADILSSLDDKIELNNAINRNLEEQAQALFKNWFIDFAPFGGEMPDDWTTASLSDIADYLNGLAMQKFRPKKNEVGLPVLKIKELRQGFPGDDAEQCSPSIKPEYIVNDGDVIFSWSGSLLVDLWCGGTCGLNQHLFKVTSQKYDKWFYYLWTKHHLDRFVFLAADKATTMGHIKREELDKAEICIPSKADYNKIGSSLEPMIETIIAKRVEKRHLTTLRDELLPKLMSGELNLVSI